MATKEEISIVRKLVSRGEIKLRGEMPSAVGRKRILSRAEASHIGEMLALYHQVVVVKHERNGKRKRGCRLYSVPQYMRLKASMTKAWDGRRKSGK